MRAISGLIFALSVACAPQPEAKPGAMAGEVAAPSADSADDAAPDAAMTGAAFSPAAANTRFGLSLYDALADDPGNIFISPASISTAFGLVYPGARGETAAEIAAALGFPADASEFAPAMGEFLSTLQIADEGRRVAINNAGWFDGRTIIEEDYLALTDAHFGAAAEKVDFRGAPAAARETINDWVEDKTEDRIQDLLSPDDVTEETRFVLVNTIYLDADWARPFKKESTREEDFRLASGEAVRIPMMNQTAYFRLYAGDGFAALDLPYRGGELSMTVFLPDDGVALAGLEARLTPDTLAEWSDAVVGNDPVRVRLKLPKLELKDKYELQDILKGEFGMARSFSNAADFTAMVDPARQPDGDGVKLDKVIHQTFLKIDEKGTEAAAATAITGVRTTSMPAREPDPIDFFADRPFLIVLRHVETGAVLFLGRIEDPR